MVLFCCKLLAIYLAKAVDPFAIKFITYYRFISIYIFPFTTLVPVIAGIITYRSLSKPLRLIFYYMFFAVLMVTANSVTMANHKPSTTVVYIFTLGEFWLISCFYREILRAGWRKVTIALAIAFSIFCISCYFFQSKSVSGSYMSAVETILILIYSLTYISTQNQLNIETSWGANSLNWVNTALLIYNATTLLMFAFYDYLLKAPMLTIIAYWVFQDIILWLEYTLFTISFTKAKTGRGR